MLARVTTASLATSALAASGAYNYEKSGADWDQYEPMCGTGKEQSPINLYKWNTEAHPD